MSKALLKIGMAIDADTRRQIDGLRRKIDDLRRQLARANRIIDALRASQKGSG
jgi:hypothetical protein